MHRHRHRHSVHACIRAITDTDHTYTGTDTVCMHACIRACVHACVRAIKAASVRAVLNRDRTLDRSVRFCTETTTWRINASPCVCTYACTHALHRIGTRVDQAFDICM